VEVYENDECDAGRSSKVIYRVGKEVSVDEARLQTTVNRDAMVELANCKFPFPRLINLSGGVSD